MLNFSDGSGGRLTARRPLTGLLRLTGLALLLLGLSRPAMAQQMAQLSQYVNNNYLLNPAVAGTEEFTDVRFSSRLQWVGLEGAPRTYYATIHSALPSRRRMLRQRQRSFSAVGGMAYSDVTGPTSRTGLYGSYARNVALNRFLHLALGVSVGVQQFGVDGAQLRFATPNPGPTGSAVAFAPDATVGVWLYNRDFYAGASVGQVLNSKLNLDFRQFGSAAQDNNLQPHYYLTGGLRLRLDRQWSLIPSALLKVTSTARALDLTLRVRYENWLWGGASLRWGDAAVGMVGVRVTDNWNLTYSYDMGISSLNTFHNGSHEVLLNVRLPHRKRLRDSRFW